MTEFYNSATKINAANYATCRYYLRYVLRLPPLRLSAYVKGSHLHTLVEHFWDRLGEPHEIKRNKDGTVTSKKKYSNAEEFATYAQRKWMRIVIADKSAEGKIKWRFENEKYFIKSQLKTICPPLFDTLKQMDPPIYSELPFDFGVNGERFKGRIDEVRKSEEGQIIVRDYKSGRPWIGEMKLSHDPQLTLYNVAICALLKFDPKMRATLGLEGKLEEFMAGGRFVSPNIKEGFFMIESLSIDPEKVNRMPEVIYETARIDEHFFALLKMIKSVRKRANEGDVYPESGKKCDDCDMKDECLKEMKCVNKGNYVDKNNHGLFDFASPAYARKELIRDVSFAATETEKPPKPLSKSEMNKIAPTFRFHYPKKISATKKETDWNLFKHPKLAL